MVGLYGLSKKMHDQNLDNKSHIKTWNCPGDTDSHANWKAKRIGKSWGALFCFSNPHASSLRILLSVLPQRYLFYHRKNIDLSCYEFVQLHFGLNAQKANGETSGHLSNEEQNRNNVLHWPPTKEYFFMPHPVFPPFGKAWVNRYICCQGLTVNKHLLVSRTWELSQVDFSETPYLPALPCLILGIRSEIVFRTLAKKIGSK